MYGRSILDMENEIKPTATETVNLKYVCMHYG